MLGSVVCRGTWHCIHSSHTSVDNNCSYREKWLFYIISLASKITVGVLRAFKVISLCWSLANPVNEPTEITGVNHPISRKQITLLASYLIRPWREPTAVKNPLVMGQHSLPFAHKGRTKSIIIEGQYCIQSNLSLRPGASCSKLTAS